MGDKINWDLVWEKFDSWYDSSETECEKCGMLMFSQFPEWPDQRDKIQALVNAQLRKRKTKKRGK